ncbi:hypothetical protein DICPUDRAFT_153099 [Dictyostelium purpureum]|uniref:Carboxypeptidase n=1 Tax=Dictyostelium purpureum TaxID=5786 RepID=F0ZN20_DICPU|nr:uncharacterized protein DICPUDRAFT_153099 [Dictyostelium purpureum]EGC34681.1 hypothetical protein DICPUDRAFT_153099 [Dictyostelium purpureum]|eukprot:XP_003288818.1 hypothetical protein DICPUDRAFT_153099 [Dictyostelium purpureum]
MNKLFICLIITIIFSNIVVIYSKPFNFDRSYQEWRKPNPKPDIHTPEYYDASYLKDLNTIKDTPDQFLVTDLPGLSDNITFYSGLINVNETSNGNLFFWFFPANVSNPLDAPFLIWLNGGPCCTSSDSVFIETGPLRFNSDGKTFHLNPWSWHNAANVLYIDQPVGTGLSFTYGDSVTNDLEINQNFYQFLQSFFTIFSDYSKLPFYMSGESYAGHYIPHMADYILSMNSQTSTNKNLIPINIAGIAMGNGYTHPPVQIASYATFGYNIGIIGINQVNEYNQLNELCQEQLKLNNYNSDECANVFNQLLSDSGTNTTSMVNMYDYRLNDPTAGDNWPQPGLGFETSYLQRADVRAAIHANPNLPDVWTECNMTCNAALTNQDESSLFLLPILLKQIKVLIYNGQFDIICNHVGTTQYLDGMEWDGQQSWNNASRFTWNSFNNEGTATVTAGYGKTFENLTFVLALGGSHMYPMDMPASSYDMIKRFLNNESFADLPQSFGFESPAPKQPVPLTLPIWIGICVGGSAFSLIVGILITFLIMRKSNKHYYRVIQ